MYNILGNKKNTVIIRPTTYDNSRNNFNRKYVQTYLIILVGRESSKLGKDAHSYIEYI